MNAKCLIPLTLLMVGPILAQDDPKQEIARISAIENRVERLSAYDALAVQLGLASPVVAKVEVAPGERAIIPVPDPSPQGARLDNTLDPHPVYDAPQSVGYDTLRHHSYLRNTWIRYHGPIAKLGITAENRAKLINLLCAREEASSDASEASAKAGAANQAELMRSVAAAQSAITSEIGQMIGDDGLQALEENTAVEESQKLLENTVGADLGLDGMPMTGSQEYALGQVYHDVLNAPRKTVPDKFGQLPVDPRTGLSESDGSILERAAAFLSAQQIAALKKSLLTSHSDMRFLIAHGAIQLR